MSDRDLICKNCGKEIKARGWTHDDSIFCDPPGLQYAEPAPVEPVPAPLGNCYSCGTSYDECFRETEPTRLSHYFAFKGHGECCDDCLHLSPVPAPRTTDSTEISSGLVPAPRPCEDCKNTDERLEALLPEGADGDDDLLGLVERYVAVLENPPDAPIPAPRLDET